MGSGIYDITGPAAETGMMGYAMLDQKTMGIHTRLRARAFVIADPRNNNRVVFVSADLCFITQAVKQKVVGKLRALYGDLYTDENLLLSATHTHSGPGGFSHYALYNITILGFSQQNFDLIVNGIYQSIVKAHNNLAPGTIKIASGELLNASVNRSPAAYNLNPSSERVNYLYDTDKQITLLNLQKLDGKEIGMINWFAVHPTSMSNQNRLISSDNKGYAGYLFEKWKGSDYNALQTFVAAFAQSNEGDVSPCPNSYGGGGCSIYNEFESTKISATKQYDAARLLYNNASEYLHGSVDYRHTYVDFSQVTIDTKFTGDTIHKTCVAAIGSSFAAGAEDGPSNFPWISEGMKYQGLILTQDQACHGVKPILLPTGRMTPYPWTPEVLPVQIVRIGNLAIIAVPGEFTTMAGRRLRETVATQLHSIGVNYVIIAGLANAYAGYVTTREEYQSQQYEGASTHFGEWTLAAYQQEFDKLAIAMRTGADVANGPTPRDLSCCQTTLQTGVVFDDVPLGKSFGSINTDANTSYSPGQTVRVIFWGGHPKNNPMIQSTYLKVQKRLDNNWVTVANDWDPETKYIWARSGLAYSLITTEWTIPNTATTGEYRIVHYGHWKSGWTGAIKPYSGTSRTFLVQ
ncbi:MAG: neutral/alkaline non-lysosomal ceramidase N-terminal domain-containing protein [Acidobacteriota bacterium]